MKNFAFIFAFLWVAFGALNDLSAQTAPSKLPVRPELPLAEPAVLLVSTPNMKPSSGVRGDYDRVKLALATELNTMVRGFATEKLAFIVYTGTRTPAEIQTLRNRILKAVPDARITQITESEAKTLK